MTLTEAREIIEKGASFKLDESETITGLIERSIKVASELGEAKGFIEGHKAALEKIKPILIAAQDVVNEETNISDFDKFMEARK